MPMSLRHAVLAAFLSFAITACAQPPAAPMPVVTPSATHRDRAESTTVTSAKEAPAMSEPATHEPERGPAIPAAELRKRLLALFGSFRSLNDLERAHVEQLLQVRLSKDPEMRMGFGYDGKTVEGWEYGVSVGKLGRLDQPSTIVIGLDNGVEPFTNQQPTYCTLEFEPLANELVAMGYQQGVRAYDLGGGPRWGFGMNFPESKGGVGIEVPVYRIRAETGREMTCIEGFDIGGGDSNG
jgi:hypothetical protein